MKYKKFYKHKFIAFLLSIYLVINPLSTFANNSSNVNINSTLSERSGKMNRYDENKQRAYVGDAWSEVDAAKKSIEIKKEIHHNDRTIDWIITFNKNREGWKSGSWQIFFLPVLWKDVVSMKYIYNGREVKFQPGRPNLEIYNNEVQQKPGAEEGVTVANTKTAFYKDQYYRLLGKHIDGNDPKITSNNPSLTPKSLRSSINWYVDQGRIKSALSHQFNQYLDRPLHFIIKTRHPDNKINLDNIPLAVTMTTFYNSTYPRSAIAGPFGIAGRHDLKYPKPVYVKDPTNITQYEQNQVKISVYENTRHFYDNVKPRRYNEINELYDAYLGRKGNKFAINNKGDVLVTFSDNTESYIFDESNLYIREYSLEANPKSIEVFDQEKISDIEILGKGSDIYRQSVKASSTTCNCKQTNIDPNTKLPKGLTLVKITDKAYEGEVTYKLVGSIEDVEFPNDKDKVEYNITFTAFEKRNAGLENVQKDVSVKIIVKENPSLIPVGTNEPTTAFPKLVMLLSLLMAATILIKLNKNKEYL